MPLYLYFKYNWTAITYLDISEFWNYSSEKTCNLTKIVISMNSLIFCKFRQKNIDIDL